MTNAPPKHRRWLQFRLRTLLIAILVLSLLLSWFAVKMERARRQREAVRMLRNLGGTVRYEWQALRNEAVMQPPHPSWLRNTLGSDVFDKVVDVDLTNTHITDAELEHLKGLPDIQLLCLGNTQVTDTGLKDLQRMPNLEILDLSGSLVTDAGLEHLQELTNLKFLDLTHTWVSDPCIERLQKAMPNCDVR